MSQRLGHVSLEAAIDRIASRGGFILGIDFDGTLAPIVDHPDLATPDERALEVLGSLATRDGVEVAVVTGRALDDLRDRLGHLAGATLVGEHGNDVGDDTLDDPLIAEATDMIRALSEEAGGVAVESKPKSVTFHYRNLEDDVAEGYLSRIRDWAGRHHELSVMEGKKVIELSTSTRTKGDAMAELAGDRPVIYIGDDTTDETVFEMLGTDDIGVKVGDGPTSARFRVKDVAEVVAILETIDLASR
jgi:trehalose 6-phosphate phosphatase